MEVLVGPTTFGIDVSSPPTPPPPSSQGETHSCLFLKEAEEEEEEEEDEVLKKSAAQDSSESSSSIGAPDDDGSSEDEDEDGGVVSSKAPLASLDSLEDSLPIKRGLSNHFSGKSKSFANLSDAGCVSSVTDLGKPENPFNKRRRILLANKWSRRSFYSWAHNPKSMPLLALDEEEEEEEEEKDDVVDDDDKGRNHNHHHQKNNQLQSFTLSCSSSSSSSSSSPSDKQQQEEDQEGINYIATKFQQRKFRTSFKFQSCLSLADLQEYEPYQ